MSGSIAACDNEYLHHVGLYRKQSKMCAKFTLVEKSKTYGFYLRSGCVKILTPARSAKKRGRIHVCPKRDFLGVNGSGPFFIEGKSQVTTKVSVPLPYRGIFTPNPVMLADSCSAAIASADSSATTTSKPACSRTYVTRLRIDAESSTARTHCIEPFSSVTETPANNSMAVATCSLCWTDCAVPLLTRHGV